MVYNIMKGWPLPIYKSTNPELNQFVKTQEEATDGINREEEDFRDTEGDFATVEGAGPSGAKKFMLSEEEMMEIFDEN
jgi:hypothetical protein